MGEISQAFKISTVIPQNVIVCNQSTLQSIDLSMPSTLAVITDGEGDILDQLKELTSLEPVLEKVASCSTWYMYICKNSVFNIVRHVYVRSTMWIKMI